MSGLDSALAPTPEQAQAAYGMGFLWWAFYIGYQGEPGAPAAFHKWEPDELKAVFDAGFELFLPIFFPRCTPELHILRTARPKDDAELAVYACGAYGVRGTVALDTEYQMRGDGWTRDYTAEWASEVAAMQTSDVCYAGGFTFGAPPPARYPWWIIPGGRQAPPGTAWQTGQTTIAGLHVDTNSIGPGFPLATRAA